MRLYCCRVLQYHLLPLLLSQHLHPLVLLHLAIEVSQDALGARLGHRITQYISPDTL